MSMAAEIRALQVRLGVAADGVIGPVTLAAINAALNAASRPAAARGWVQIVQGRLGLPEDGRLGPKTLAALFVRLGADPATGQTMGRAAAQHMPSHGITATPARLAEWLGEMAHESDGFRALVENLRYGSAARIRAVWPTRFPTAASAAPFVRQPEKLANLVYAGRMGNGPPSSGDGWRFRGRGIIHLTGRENYRRAGLEATPDAAADPATAVRIACDYWTERALNTLADAGQSDAISARINGKHPANGLADRRRRKALARELLT